MEKKAEGKPDFKESEIEEFIEKYYGLKGNLSPLPAYEDQNFLLKIKDNQKYVVKIANQSRTLSELKINNSVMNELSNIPIGHMFPIVVNSKENSQILKISNRENHDYYLRMITYLPGKPYDSLRPLDEKTFTNLGEIFGQMNAALLNFSHPNMEYDSKWDLAQLDWISTHTQKIIELDRRAIVEYCFLQYQARVKPQLNGLPMSVIHNDGNGDNVLLQIDKVGGWQVSGIIDFGDTIYTHTINELAILCAYALHGEKDIIPALQSIAKGYHKYKKLTEIEIQVLFPLILMRNCISGLMSSIATQEDPKNAHRQVSASAVWELLEKNYDMDWLVVENAVRDACGFSQREQPTYGRKNRNYDQLINARKNSIGSSLSLAYQKPLEFLRGNGQFLFDRQDHAYLDCVNNISHIGHSHPKISEALHKQASILNTNTRYLHPLIIEYSQRLTATFPDPLSVCYFVNSGSEANELAIRIARAHAARKDVIVLEDAYHGNTQTLVDLSPYKSEGPGGKGLADWAHKVIKPDSYTGLHRGKELGVGQAYAEFIKEKCGELEKLGTPPALFLVESILGCGGQIVLPEGYLQAAFNHIRNSGGLAIVDEVQVGMGRVGSHWWAFESQNVVPDIVTIGKPMGNGHPVAAVVTTPEIASSFNNGMEYFNSFGGNPVSMAVAHAVMDVIEEEGLMGQATRVGEYLQAGFVSLARRHKEIGDVRGLGMFIGVELVLDRESRKPAAQLAGKVIEKVLEDRILLSVEGPGHNVMKIKPPLQFSEVDADLLLGAVDRALTVLK